MVGREEPPKAEAWPRYGRTSAESRGIAPHPLACVISFPSTRFLPRSRFLVMLSSALARRSVASARGARSLSAWSNVKAGPPDAILGAPSDFFLLIAVLT